VAGEGTCEAEREAKKAEREAKATAKEAEREAKKAERDAKKAERDAKKAEREATATAKKGEATAEREPPKPQSKPPPKPPPPPQKLMQISHPTAAECFLRSAATSSGAEKYFTPYYASNGSAVAVCEERIVRDEVLVLVEIPWDGERVRGWVKRKYLS
jgi:hypothetical protein